MSRNYAPVLHFDNFISVCQTHIWPAGEPESTSQDTPCGSVREETLKCSRFRTAKREISVAVLPVVGQDAMKPAGDNDTSTAVARKDGGKMHTHV